MYGRTSLSELMQTRCDHCDSRFRVTENQLQQALGRVRCSVCGEVFNAMHSLQSLPEEDYLPAPEVTEEILIETPVEPEPVVVAAPEQNPEISLHEAMYGSQKRSFFSVSPFLLVILILLFAALGTVQSIYYLRYQLIEDSRFQKQVLNICRVLPCDTELFASTRQMKLLERNVFSHPSRDNALMINGSFMNQATFTQRLPDLLVSLFDIQGKLIANRVFSPAEYLTSNKRQTTIQPNKPVQFLLEVIDPGTDALTYEFEFL